MNISDSSCVPFGWKGRYAGPGKFSFAFPAPDKVMVFTDHSVITFMKDEAIVDAGMWADSVFVATNTSVREM